MGWGVMAKDSPASQSFRVSPSGITNCTTSKADVSHADRCPYFPDIELEKVKNVRLQSISEGACLLEQFLVVPPKPPW